ncbi:pentatricopeptide repeat-containing protein At3g46790, chloroplastic-like [Selaginella moellendorffii]|uniref:pentatricopeptide repeat-containing protein At3g46790, chloroplastic-like n=1 Tax=Selaginella moellendorffii TaxID=88036 RepID=UPI000D1C3992|nr:pentatricopeptide repeat-containing protein At3g46790, chloroplastic-like [Selaginella moellendorffii]|eukprot:XP_024536027.1 pentatricopeptide repeat-containing protein At3g46790, chloroplastic-like [Selaginella moellendorffii]
MVLAQGAVCTHPHVKIVGELNWKMEKGQGDSWGFKTCTRLGKVCGKRFSGIPLSGDNRFKKKNKFFSESYPDFKHVSTGESLWIANRKTPTWVSAKLESLADPAVGKATTARYKSPHTPPVAGDEPVSLGRLIHRVRDSAESRSLSLGKQAHEAVLKSDEHKSNIYLLTGLIDIADNTIQANACTYTGVLVACGSVMAIKLGREIHQLAKHKGLLKNNPVLGSSLVSFYGKCGDVDSAQEAFDECRSRDNTGLWNSLIQAYTLQGRSIEALERFYSMTQEEGCKADDVSFVSVLNACSHGGLVGKGRQLLDEMPKQYGVKPRLEHYVCPIDMLGRANLLDEAVRVLRAMPFEPDAVVWTSLLGACRKWKNYTIGKLAFERLVEMDPKSGTPYALMANIFGNLGMLSEMAAVVERMRVKTASGSPGEAGGRMLALFLFLGEKLALGCALVNSHQKETIRIVKNFRVCDDCHAATALISKLEKRLIIYKDASRVHVFQDGRCSCDNYF